MSVTLTLEDEIDVSRGEMLVHPDNMPLIGRNFEAMLVWMDEEKMDMEKSFFLKQTTNTSRTRIDSIKYKVDINTMEHLSVENGTSDQGRCSYATQPDSPCGTDFFQGAVLRPLYKE